MYSIIKRFFDIFFSLIGLFVLSPFFLIIMIVLKLTAEGEVFYLQERIGFNNEKIKIFKFATMLKNSLNIGSGSITLKNDYRVTKFGKILRKSKINELPQLINVLLGDISFVGPRPLVKKTFEAYSKRIQKEIVKVKPGVTGIGSIFFRDEESIISNNSPDNPHEFYKTKIAPFKGKLEMWYIENKSFNIDLKLLVCTIWVIFFSKSQFYLHWFNNLPKKDF